MQRWMRRVLRRYRIDVPFTGVVCPEHVKTIRVGEDGRTEVTVRRALVFLDLPEPGDLCDVLPVSTGCTVIHDSPDAYELLRRERDDATVIYWTPREPILRYAVYVHEHGWTSAGSHEQAALYSEFHCEKRTGTMRLEIRTPGVFEAAVVFERPRWRPIVGETGLVKYALRLLDTGGERPELLDGGHRLEWRLAGPRVGARYVCVAFQQDGVAQWQRRLDAGSFSARLRRLVSVERWLSPRASISTDTAETSGAGE